MAWTTQPYATLADVKMALDPTLGTTEDGFLSQLLSQAQADLDREIGYSFQQDGTANSPSTRYYDGRGLQFLEIDDLVAPYSLVSGAVFETVKITNLSTNGTWISGSSTTTDITADIIYQPNNYSSLGLPAHKLVRNSGLGFAAGTANYKVLGIWGQPYQSIQAYPGVPNDLSRACVRLTIHYFKMRDTNYANVMQETGGIRLIYSKDWPADVLRVVNNYQHTRFRTR